MYVMCTYNFLFLLKLDNLSIKRLESILQVILMFKNGNFIFFLDSQLHFPYLQSLFKLTPLLLHIDTFFLFRTACFITLVKVSAQVLYFFLLLPKNLSQFVRCMSHISQHIPQFNHGFGRLVEYIPSGRVIQIQLVYRLPVRIDVSLIGLYL